MQNKFLPYMQGCFESLAKQDPHLFKLIEEEHQRQNNSLILVASSGVAYPSVIAASTSDITNLTLEGYIGNRFHAGCEVIDQIEHLAIERAKLVFKARYANVQPLSAAIANNGLLFSLLNANDTILGMHLDAGGHLTHGAKASISGKYFNAISYGVNSEGLIDYDEVRALAKTHQPKLIICGASAYPRLIDYKIFREIADEVGSYLLADISHIAGLIAAELIPSPIDDAHFVVTSTSKQLYGPRGGLILMGKDADTIVNGKTLANLVQNSIFPGIQGAPNLASVTAKTVMFGEILSNNTFLPMMKRVQANAQYLANALTEKGYRVVAGGTDTHMVLVDVFSSKAMTGFVAEKALEQCRVIVNKNRIPEDQHSVFVTSGIRFGTNTIAYQGMEKEGVIACVDIVDKILSATQYLDKKKFELNPKIAQEVKEEIIHIKQNLCNQNMKISRKHESFAESLV
ncbi:serine hydroxymethyltransferase [Legionella busanensis]|uniref:Probable serine hydroxymethyltransferase n=1 Tax=Legionella busanensis TaxID=190655 RepID=A0A378JJS2_9GAMM|nr:serine hydroxymethyltransferase [Legionella busanensis]STX51317.1 serine hydroxymethyltransferase [Legionella busanensis]